MMRRQSEAERGGARRRTARRKKKRKRKRSYTPSFELSSAHFVFTEASAELTHSY